MRVTIFGATGLLGKALVRQWTDDDVSGLGFRDADIRNPKQISNVLEETRPNWIVLAAAYTDVDGCEGNPEHAFDVNCHGALNVATAAKQFASRLLFLSTDYVFDGAKTSPYTESDAPAPLSVYAESKLAGERLALARCRRAFVIRVCGLYGVAQSATAGRTNFVETMLRLAGQGHALRVVRDQVLTPSYTLDLAPKVWRVLARGAPGLYHLANAGQTSFYDFAREIFRLSGLTPSLTPVTAAEYGARARRPPYSVMARTRLAALGEDDLRPWQAALAAYLRERVTRATAPAGS